MERRNGRPERLVGWRDAGLFALLTFVPLVLGGRGRLNADTKQYLYLDPGELLDRARHLWDPALGGGTVSHQAIGYLWPMGPYYWAAEAVGLPDWVAQRCWIGLIQFVAALGALALLRHLLPRHPAQLVGAALYGLSPFVLGHVTGQSGLLLPFAAFGWLVLCVALACERDGGDLRRGWRWPAAFALVVTTCGSLNGSSTFFVIFGAVLWVPYAVFVLRDLRLWRGLLLVAQLGTLTLLTQLWWLVAYAIGGRYGLPILSVTENVRTTATTTSAAEILRGLGYWFFYGRDKLGPWLVGIAPDYLRASVIVVTFAVPILALFLGALVRWRHRTYFAGLVVVGTTIAVGAFAEPQSPAGSVFERLSRQSDLVLSLRNTQRAAPLVILGLAAMVAAGGAALQRRHGRIGAAVLAATALVVAGAMPAQWRSGLIAERFHRGDVAAAWKEAARRLDADRDGAGRVLELPGIDFASYRWGHTLDPVLTGLTKRDVLFRELVPAGGAAGASLLIALDGAMQEGTLEPAAIAPVARLLGIDDIVFRGDLEYERYRTVRPKPAWALLTDPAAALGAPIEFNPGYDNRAIPSRPMLDELELGSTAAGAKPPQVAIFPVARGGRPALSTAPVDTGTVLAGDGEGVVAAAAAGLLGEQAGPLLLASDVRSATAADRLTGSSTRYVVTDTNRKRAGRWYSLRENAGATEPTDAPVVTDDPSDARLEVTPGAGAGTKTVVEWRGAERVWANGYGNPFTLLPEDRPVNAFDGDVRTSWRLDPVGRDDMPRIGLTLEHASTADHLTLVPVSNRPGTTIATRVRVTLDSSPSRVFDATAPAAPSDLRVDLDGKPFRTVEVQILDRAPATGPTGFAEVAIPGVQVTEMVRLPTDVLARLGPRAGQSPLALVLSRHRANPAEVVRRDPEPALARTFTLGSPARFHLDGTARLDPAAPEPRIDVALGLPGAAAGGWTATATEHLAGSIAARGASAFDGDATTAWTTPFVGLEGQHVEVDAGRAVRLDALDIGVVADAKHSTPRQLQLSMDGGAATTIDLPPAPPGPDGNVVRHHIALPAPLAGRVLQVTITSAEERQVTDWYTESPVALPVAIAEITVPGLAARPLPASFAACRDDLMTVDGRPLSLRLTGAPAEAAAGKAARVETCDGAPLELAAGSHDIRTAPGLDTAIDVDRLVLTTDAWSPPAASPRADASVTITQASTTAYRAKVKTDGRPFWLVLDQSMNAGWALDMPGAKVSGPRTVDSYAAGWLVTPLRAGTFDVAVRWTPQRTVDVALAVSAAGALLCLALLVLGRRRQATAHRERPEWIDTLAPDRRVVQAAVLVVVTTAFTAIFVHPLMAPAAAAVALATAWRPRLARFLPAALVAFAGAQIAFFQFRDGHRIDGLWAQWFGGAHLAAFLGVVALGAGAAWEAASASSAASAAGATEDVEH